MTSKNKEQSIIAGALIVSIVIFMWAINGSVSDKSKTNESEEENEGMETTLASPAPVISSETSSSTEPSIPEGPATTLAKRKPRANRTESTMPEIKCYYNTDCGVNGTMVSKEYTCYDGSIYQQYISFKCVHPGTAFAECVGQEKMELVKSCAANEQCIDGEWYCAYGGVVSYVNDHPAVPQNATFYGLTDTYETYYKDYRMQIVYIISENSKPRGITIDLFRPDGVETWEFVYERGPRIDNFTIGYTELYNNDVDGLRAKIWISDVQ